MLSCQSCKEFRVSEKYSTIVSVGMSITVSSLAPSLTLMAQRNRNCCAKVGYGKTRKDVLCIVKSAAGVSFVCVMGGGTGSKSSFTETVLLMCAWMQ